MNDWLDLQWLNDHADFWALRGSALANCILGVWQSERLGTHLNPYSFRPGQGITAACALTTESYLELKSDLTTTTSCSASWRPVSVCWKVPIFSRKIVKCLVLSQGNYPEICPVSREPSGWELWWLSYLFRVVWAQSSSVFRVCLDLVSGQTCRVPKKWDRKGQKFVWLFSHGLSYILYSYLFNYKPTIYYHFDHDWETNKDDNIKKDLMFSFVTRVIS